MPSMLTIIVVLVGGVVAYALGRAMMASLKRGGAAEIERDEARRDREDARKQSEIMLQERETEDVARDLDRGDF